MIMALLNPKLAPKLPPEERNVPIGDRAVVAGDLVRAAGRR